MAGSKRMSKEEKCKAVLGIYHNNKEVYTEKEIVQLASKAGVNSNTWVLACCVMIHSLLAVIVESSHFSFIINNSIHLFLSTFIKQ